MITGRYTTLAALKRERGLEAITTDDDLLTFYLTAASAMLTRFTHRAFVPYRAANQYTVEARDSIYRLRLDGDLLTALTVTNGDAANTAITTFTLLPRNVYPKYQIELSSATTDEWAFDDRDSVVTVTGFWGFHPDYTRAWAQQTTLNGAIASTTVTTFVFTSTASLVVGDYLKIGSTADYEIMRVSSVTNATTAELVRGELGTTASTHANGAAVYTYQFPADVDVVTRRLAVYLYNTYDTGVNNAVQIVNTGAVLLSELPKPIQHTINGLTRFAITHDDYSGYSG